MFSYERRQRFESDGLALSAPPTAAAQPIRHQQQQQPTVDAPSKAKPASVSADWAAVVLKVLDELERFNNPKASISMSVNHLVSFQSIKA